MTHYTSTANQFEINGICVSHIIFDEGNYATLWAKCRIADRLKDIHLIIEIEKLNDLLRFSGEFGEKVLLQMIDEMMMAKEAPYVLNFLKTFGKEALFTSCKFTVSLIDTKHHSDTQCFLITDVMPISFIQQAKNISQHVRDFNESIPVNTQQINVCVNQLGELYAYYLGLIELDINEESAREKSQLINPQLFQMAQLAYNNAKVK